MSQNATLLGPLTLFLPIPRTLHAAFSSRASFALPFALSFFPVCAARAAGVLSTHLFGNGTSLFYVYGEFEALFGGLGALGLALWRRRRGA